jgi:hypothetical protein
MRALSLIKSYPVIFLLAVACGWLLWSSWQTEEQLGRAMADVERLQQAKSLAKECSDSVKLIQSDCRAEVADALAGVEPIVIEIERPAKGAGEFNEWIEERIR